MKTFIRKAALFTALTLTVATATFAREQKLVYNRNHNTAIGITVDNATGASYTIRDEKGTVVLTGTVKNNKTFFIPTGKLDKGTYRFVIGSLVLQEFEIK